MYPAGLPVSRSRQLLCPALARAKLQGWAQQEPAPLPCCQRRWAGKTGRVEGEKKPVSTSSMAWGWLWLIACKLPTTVPCKMPHRCLNMGWQWGTALCKARLYILGRDWDLLAAGVWMAAEV